MVVTAWPRLRLPDRARGPGDSPVLQVQADPVPVVHPVRDEAGEAPLQLLGGAGHAQRAVPDPLRRRARVLVRRRHEPRPELGLHGARQHARVHVEGNLPPKVAAS